MMQAFLLNIVVALSMAAAVSSFAPHTHCKQLAFVDQRSERRQNIRRTFSPMHPNRNGGRQTERQALVYEWDGSDNSLVAVEDYGHCTHGSSSSFSPFGLSASSVANALCEKISRDSDRIGSLARIATAFSPPERRIRLGDIEHVAAVGVCEGRIEIQAVVPQGEGCVTLLIPVDFPFRCDHPREDEKEACILGNLDMLDREALDRIQRLGLAGSALEREYGNEGARDNAWQAYNSLGMEDDMVRDCEETRDLLNEEEFRGDVVLLAEWALISSGGKEGSFRIQKALVSEVTPEGMFFSVEASSSDGAYVMQVRLPFERKALDGGQLREAVMDAISKAESRARVF